MIHALEVPEHPFQAATFELVRMQGEIHRHRARLREQIERVAPR